MYAFLFLSEMLHTKMEIQEIVAENEKLGDKLEQKMNWATNVWICTHCVPVHAVVCSVYAEL